MPLVLSITSGIPRAFAAASMSRICGMDRRLAARQLHRLGLALGGDERVQHRLDLLERERVAVGLVAGARLGEADRAVEVAAGVDLDDPEAGVLGVLGADAAVARAAQLASRSGAAAATRRAGRSAARRASGPRRRTRAPRSGRARGTRAAGSRARRGRSAPRRAPAPQCGQIDRVAAGKVRHAPSIPAL